MYGQTFATLRFIDADFRGNMTIINVSSRLEHAELILEVYLS
jgi:hypothetical protein